MNIVFVTYYLDGGTMLIQNDKGENFWVDSRIHTITKGIIYDLHPGNRAAVRYDDEQLDKDILKGLETYEEGKHKQYAQKLFNNRL